MITKAILCGMKSEHDVLARVFADEPRVHIYSGNDRLNLPKLVPHSVNLMIDMGLCGGIGPNVHVPDAVIATSLRHKRGPARDMKTNLFYRLQVAATMAHIQLKPVPYFSSGLFNTSDTLAERIAICDAYPEHPEAMSDETRFADAFTDVRGIAFAVCRVASDSRYEDANLPPAARGHILSSDGTIDIEFLVRSLAVDPLQIPALVKLSADLNRALGVLEQVARAIKPAILTYEGRQ